MQGRVTLLVLLSLLVVFGTALQKNTNLSRLRAETQALERSIRAERVRIAVLRAEHANLTRLTRLQRLITRHAPHLRTVQPSQMIVLEADDVLEERRAAAPPAAPVRLTYEAIR